MRVRYSSILPMLAMVSLVSAPVAAAEDDFPNALAESEDATRLEPASPWNIDFGENRCRLARFFGSDEERHLLMFEQAAPRDQFGMTVAGPEISRFQSSTRLYIRMERDEPMEKKERFARADIPTIGPAIIIVAESIGPSVPEGELRNAGINLEEASTIDRVVLQSGNRTLTFETGDMSAPFQALNTCTSQLLSDWGLDPEKHQSYAVPQWINEADIVRRIVDNYPRSALNAGEQAIFRMRVIVEEDGRVSQCHMENSTEVRRLESPACGAMMRARFDPARDAEGNSMRSFYATTVSYRIGG